MAIEFQLLRDPQPSNLAELEARFPANVFSTAAYARSMASLGQSVCILTVRRDGALEIGCLGLVRRGRLSRSLEITSLPSLGPDTEQAFWTGLRESCAALRITELGVYSFGSSTASIPSVGVELSRARRTEFVLDLDGTDPWPKLDKKHQQSLKKARQSNLVVRSSTDAAALDDHVRLMTLSLERHANKGETIGDGGDPAMLRALLENRSGKVYQVISDGKTLSSATVLRSKTGAYYHTAGNHPDGLAVGASHFLLYEIAAELSRESATEFNLGGTHPSNEGLVRFKTRFGARPVDLEAASFYLGGKIRQHLISASRTLRAGR